MIKKAILLVPCIVMTGCDPSSGPILRNEFSEPVEMTIQRSDGRVYSSMWPLCLSVHSYAIEVGPFADNDILIERITVERGNELLYDLSSRDIERLLEKEESIDSTVYWVIDESGIHMSLDEECSIKID